MFAMVYLPHYFQLPHASFHHEFIRLLADREERFIAITGFRGSAKSTLAGLALPLFESCWGTSKFILPINETDDIVRLTIANIRQELEHNHFIRQDFGTLLEKLNGLTKFAETSILLRNGVRIMGRSRGQKIRGLRHREYRPDLVIIDDPEELDKVQKKEYRDKTEQWIKSNIIPAINETKARLIVIGNVLHTDSILPRLKNNKIFTYREYPLVDAKGVITWKAKYPDQQALADLEDKVGRTAYLREFMLKVVPPEGQEIKEEWLCRYERLPERITQCGVGVDLAISKKETADFTAMVRGVATIDQGRPKIYILPNPINAHLSFHETIQQMKAETVALQQYAYPHFFIEDVGYQKAAIQEAERNMIPVTAMKVAADKRARLRSVALFIQNGTVLFPRTGCEDLLAQLLGFGVEDHDDLVDAFVYLILGLSSMGMEKPEIIVLG